MTRKTDPNTTPTSAIMTRSMLTVASDESVLMTYELVRRAGVHHAPVMARDGHCVGLVSVAVLAARAAIPPGPPYPTVGELVTEVVTTRSEASVADTARTMIDADVDAVLVIDDEQLVGLVTWRDIVGFVAGTTRPDHGASHSHPVLFSLEPVIELADRN